MDNAIQDVSSSIVRQAVKGLRVHLGDTHQAFALRLGMSIATVVRYELSRVPRGKALLRLAEVAMSSGLEGNGNLFLDALWGELGLPKTYFESFSALWKASTFHTWKFSRRLPKRRTSGSPPGQGSG